MTQTQTVLVIDPETDAEFTAQTATVEVDGRQIAISGSLVRALYDAESAEAYAEGSYTVSRSEYDYLVEREDIAADALAERKILAARENDTYYITDERGDDYYNDSTVYATREQADAALVEAQRWAENEAAVEPSWKNARLVVRAVRAR